MNQTNGLLHKVHTFDSIENDRLELKKFEVKGRNGLVHLGHRCIDQMNELFHDSSLQLTFID